MLVPHFCNGTSAKSRHVAHHGDCDGDVMVSGKREGEGGKGIVGATDAATLVAGYYRA